MTDKAKVREIRARLNKIAPEPAYAEVTATQLGRYMAVRAQERFTKGLDGPVPLTHTEISAMTAEFAAEFALRALTEHAPQVADEIASQVWGAICDGGGIGEWLWDHLGEDTARQVAGLARELAEATKPAAEASGE